MAWRKWLVRTLVFTTAAGLAVAAFFYQRWTDPEKVRRQVLEQLSKRFTGAHISADSAQFHLFGGITVSDVRFARRNDADHADFLSIPTLTVYLDKEQLLHGQQKVRKLELDRPYLRLVRDAAGQWNCDGLLPPVDLNEAIPTILIHHGTILVEDRLAAAQAPALEIKDVNLTILNDPLLVLSFAGSGSSDLGPVQIAASYHRASTETKISLEGLAVPVGPALVQHLACYGPDLATHARQLEGVGKLHVELGYHPEAPKPWTQDIHFQLRQGKLVHARLPMPLEQLEASIHYVDGRVPSVKVSARAGPAKADLAIKDLDYARVEEGLEHAVGELAFHIEHLALTHELLASVPRSIAGLDELERDYEPRGPVSADITLRRDPNGGWHKHGVIKPEDVRAEFAKFPYALEHLTGIIEQDGGSGAPDVLRLDLVGRAGERPVTIRGEIRYLVPGATPTPDHAPAAGQVPPPFVSVEIRGENVPLDDKLMAALLPKGQKASKYQDLARKFHPQGLADFQAFIHRDGRSPRFANRFLISFHQAALCYDVFRYPLENVTGTLDIQQDHWEFHDFHGTHKGGEFHGRGRSIPSPDGERAEVFIDGTNLLLDDELKAALEEDLQRTWTKLAPAGRVNFAARVDVPPSATAPPHKPELDLQVHMRGCTIRPDFFKYTLRDLTGKARYAKHWVMLDDVQARHGSSVISLRDGLVFMKEGGGVWAQLGRLHGTPLVPDDELLKALPDCLTKACRCMQWRDPVQLETKLVIDTRPDESRPTIYWDGAVTLRNAALKTGVDLSDVSGTVACVGLHDGHQLQGLIGNLALEQATVFRQPFRAIQGRLEIAKEEPDVLKIPGLYTQFCGGEVYGPIRVEFGPTVRYELNLTGSRVKLEEFARQNSGLKSELSGEATAQVYLAGRGDNIDDLKGNGRIDVPKGKIENLPPLVNLLKFLALRLPDRTAFEEAHAEFEVQGPRARVTRLDLFGNAISLRGQGDLRLDGSDLNLDFNADWARFAQVLPPGIKQIPPAISNQLLRIKMRGSVEDPKFHKDFVPLVTDPVKKMWNEMRGEPSPGQGRWRE